MRLRRWARRCSLPFGWVRLAQRIPVRIHIDKVPPDIVLSAGMTASGLASRAGDDGLSSERPKVFDQ
jgi:multidrug resistance efflux pump